MIRIVLAGLIAIALSPAFSQSNNPIVQGQIVDSKTKAPVAFAHVHGKGDVTSSNQLGKFLVSLSNQADTVFTISCVGYETLITSKSKIEKEPLIYLSSKTEVLKEVVVRSINPEQILQKAHQKLERNFLSSEFSSTFTLNQYIFNDSEELIGRCDSYGWLRHKFIDTTKTFPWVQIDSMIVSRGFIRNDTISDTRFNVGSTRHNSSSPYFFLEVVEPIRYLLTKGVFPKRFYDGVNISLEGISEINGKDHYFISVIPKTAAIHLFEAYFLINSKDLSPRNVMLKIPVTLPNGKKARGRAHVSVSYEKRKNKFVISNMDILLTKDKFTKEDRELFKPYYYFSTFQFLDIKTKGMDFIRHNLLLKKSSDPLYTLVPVKLVGEKPVNEDWELIKKGKFLKPVAVPSW